MTYSPSRARPRIGFVVDHPKRDLAGGVMLAHAFAGHDFETALVPLYEQAVDVPLLGLDALIVNFARPVNLELVRSYRDAGIPVWVLDTEGGVLAEDGANSPDTLAAFIRNSGFAELLAGYFFWGSTLHGAFVRGSGIPERNLHLTGCPRFDFAALAWRDVLAFDRDGYILVNANFSFVNPLFAGSAEKERDTAIAAGWDKSYLDRVITDSRQIMAGFIETIANTAKRLPQRQFLVRPHPFENANCYRQAFAGQPNVTVDSRGSVLNVIHHADCVVHLGCGTSIEALKLNTLPISLEFLNTPLMSGHMRLPSQVSLPAASEDELLDTLRDLPRAQAGFDFAERHERLVKPWFHLNDGGAAARVAATIADSVSSSGGAAPSVRRSLAASRPDARLGQRLQAALANAIGSRASSRLRAFAQPLRRAKQLDATSIRQLADALARHAGTPATTVAAARHPLTGASLASVVVVPGD